VSGISGSRKRAAFSRPWSSTAASSCAGNVLRRPRHPSRSPTRAPSCIRVGRPRGRVRKPRARPVAPLRATLRDARVLPVSEARVGTSPIEGRGLFARRRIESDGEQLLFQHGMTCSSTESNNFMSCLKSQHRGRHLVVVDSNATRRLVPGC